MEQSKIRDAVLALSLIFVLSFLFNYIWESLHEAFLYEPCKLEVSEYIQMILYVSLIDASIILGIYLGTAVLWKDILWVQKMDGMQVLVICIAGMVIAAIIEYRGALVLRKWSYGPGMPTIFGIGLSPLLQLSTTGLLTFWVVRRMLYRRC
ncbi:MAG: hypothetical protein C4538_03970 [Nitrospiraceae bacterium]|nr:MAG: hypothetical protein C4538_03970 [Nitrospiraceae bacterium]